MAKVKYYGVFYNGILHNVYSTLDAAKDEAADLESGEFFNAFHDKATIVSGLENIRRNSGYSLQEIKDETI